jgi:hypothetical protein
MARDDFGRGSHTNDCGESCRGGACARGRPAGGDKFKIGTTDDKGKDMNPWVWGARTYGSATNKKSLPNMASVDDDDNNNERKRKQLLMMMEQQQQQQQQPQILRVRRRRCDADSAAVNALRIAARPPPPPQFDTLLANWRVSESPAEPATQQAQPVSVVFYDRVAAPTGTTKKRRKDEIFDAYLLEEEEDEPHHDGTNDDHADHEPPRKPTITRRKKRRKLQIVDHQGGPRSTANRVIGGVEYPTLTPAQSRVNESLLLVFQAERSLSEHLAFLQTTFAEGGEWKVWLHWCCSPGGTILHAAALWDQATLLQSLVAQARGDHNVDLLLSSELLHVLDEEGHSALDIARLACHASMIEWLDELERQSEFVYDYYEFRPQPIITDDTTTTLADGNNDDDDDDDDQLAILDCELLRHNAVYNAGGVATDGSDLFDYTGNHNDTYTEEPDEEDADDSNDEDFFANDYPDEEESSDDDDDNDHNFRDYGGDDGEFDPAYGGIYGQQQEEEDYD